MGALPEVKASVTAPDVATGVSQYVPSEAVLMFTLAHSSSVQKATRPTIGLTAVGAFVLVDQEAWVAVPVVGAGGTVSDPSFST